MQRARGQGRWVTCAELDVAAAVAASALCGSRRRSLAPLTWCSPCELDCDLGSVAVASPQQPARLRSPHCPCWQTCWDVLPLGSGLTTCTELELPKGGYVAEPVLLSQPAVVMLVRPVLPSLALTAPLP